MNLSKLILDGIAAQPPEPPRNYIGASSIGKPCSRAIWYAYQGIQATLPTPQLQITWDMGRTLETLLLDYIAQAGIGEVERPNAANDYLACQDSSGTLQGHADALLHFLQGTTGAVVLELKTANNGSWRKFVKEGLLSWSRTYYYQLMAYMGMLGCSQGVLLALNKDTSELHHEWVHYNPETYAEIQQRALEIASATVPPERINRSPSYYICSACSYRTYCHSATGWTMATQDTQDTHDTIREL